MPRVAWAYQTGSITAAESPSYTRPAIIKDAATEEIALLALLSFAPVQHITIVGNSLWLQSAGINRRLSRHIWGGDVVYGPKPTGEALTGKLRFSTAGGTARIKAAISQRRYGAGAPDRKGGIGVTTSSIEGVDAIVPALGFSLTWPILSNNITDDWVKAVARITGKTNNAPWKKFDIGEVKFKGMDGERETGKKFSYLTFNFEASENATDLDVGLPGGVKVTKGGHEYLEVVGVPTFDAVAGVLVANPTWAYVSQVSRSADFTILGLGS